MATKVKKCPLLTGVNAIHKTPPELLENDAVMCYAHVAPLEPIGEVCYYIV
jgi:hypothetical protein